MKFSFLIVFSLIGFIMMQDQLSAYQPGKWSPMDVYIEKGQKGGPEKLILKDESGKVVESAVYKYNAEGRLLEEKYYNDAGKYTGRTEYVYAAQNLAQEILYDANDKVVTRKELNYGKKTIDVLVLDADGKEIIRHYIRHNKMKITSGREYDQNSKDQFVVEYDKKGRAVKFKMIRSDGSSISEILYSYSELNRIIERKLSNDSFQSVCRYTYDVNGNISSYTYYNLTPAEWKKYRTVELQYSGLESQKKILSRND